MYKFSEIVATADEIRKMSAKELSAYVKDIKKLIVKREKRIDDLEAQVRLKSRSIDMLKDGHAEITRELELKVVKTTASANTMAWCFSRLVGDQPHEKKED